MRLLLLGTFLASRAFSGAPALDPGVPVLTEFTAETFPASWQTADIRATAVSLSAEERARSLKVVAKAFSRYPDAVLDRELERVFVLRRINFYGLDYGGTNSSDTVYLANDGAANGYTDSYLEAAFHHELSSIVLRNHMARFDVDGWKAANPTGFRYGDGGTAALRTGQASTAVDERLMADGFVSQYSKASLEEDFNMVAECLFMGRESFWRGVDRHPALAKKAQLAIALYGTLDPVFNEAWFRTLSK